MRNQAVGAVLDPLLRIGKVAPALVAQCIQRTVAKQAAEAIFIHTLMAGKIFTFFILKKIVVGHILPPKQGIDCLRFLLYNTPWIASRKKGIFLEFIQSLWDKLFALSAWDITIQAIGFLALAISLISFQFKKHGQIMLCRTTSELIFALQYILMREWSGAAMDGISIVRNTLYTRLVKKNRSTTPVIIGFCFFVVIIGIVTFKGIISLLPIISKLLTTISYGMKNERLLRLITLPSCIFWIVYNVYVGSAAGALADSLTLISLLIAMYKFDFKKEDAA